VNCEISTNTDDCFNSGEGCDIPESAEGLACAEVPAALAAQDEQSASNEQPLDEPPVPTRVVEESSEHIKQVEVRVALIGNVDSGKSTLTGVLSRGMLDDGRGSARAHVFVHAHELESGRTSNVSTELIGFKGDTQVLPAHLRNKNKENDRDGLNGSADSRSKSTPGEWALSVASV
jgi:GTPase